MLESKNKQKQEQLKSLKKILMRQDVDVIYSKITIDEIGQILDKAQDKGAEYFYEHYYVLEQLEAKFIDPSSKKLINEKASKVALQYLKGVRNSYNTPYPHFLNTLEEFSRKISGLPIEKSLSDIGKNMINTTNNITNDSISQINSLNENNYEEPIKSIITTMKKDIPKLIKESLPTTNPFVDIENITFGTKAFREHELTKRVKDSNPSPNELVIELKKRWKEENLFSNLNAFIKYPEESKIFYAYTLLNWLGYFADDFTKVKENTDRFNASQNDMKHASYASMATFLISNDEKFREKTIVCYMFADVKTKVCSVETYLEKYAHNSNFL